MTPIKFLERLLEFFSDEARWTQGFFAKTVTGEHCASRAPEATCWCLVGACNKLVRDGGDDFYYAHEAASKLLHDQVAKRGFNGLDRFNDDYKTTIEDIRQVINDSITEARCAI